MATEHEPIGRLCKVDNEYGYFLTWEQYAKPLEASPFVGGAAAGQYSQLFAIIEFEDRVQRVDPTEVIFCDEQSASLHCFNELERMEKK